MSSSAIDSFIQLNRAFLAMGGKSMYSDEMCGRLLAFAALCAAEDTVLNPALHGAIRVAQDQFNFNGGEVPHADKLVYWRKAMQDLRDKGAEAEWWPAFAERYSIDKRRWPLFTTMFKDMAEYFKGPMLDKPVPRLREEDRGEHASKLMARLRGDDDDDSPTPSPSIRLRE